MTKYLALKVRICLAGEGTQVRSSVGELGFPHASCSKKPEGYNQRSRVSQLQSVHYNERCHIMNATKIMSDATKTQCSQINK